MAENKHENKQAPRPLARHWRQVHKRKDPRMLYAEDLGPAGTKRDANFNESGLIEVSGIDGKGKKQLPFIGIAGRKRLGLNTTNCKTIETITGSPDWERWRGWFTLVVIRIKYRDPKSGAQVETDAIRIAPTRPRPDPNDRPLPLPEPEPADQGETEDDLLDEEGDALGSPDAAEAAEIARLEAEAAKREAGR